MSNKKNMIKIKVGSGEAFADILDIDIQLDDKVYKLGELLAKELLLEKNIDALRQYVDKENTSLLAKMDNIIEQERVADELLAKSVELLSKKVARLEKKMEG